MKNILNSFNSGLFRTLGKLVAYFLLGYILLSYLNVNDIKFPHIFDVLDVYANTINMEYYNNGLDYISGAKFYNWTSSTQYSELSNSQTYIEGSDFGYDYSVMTSGSVTNFGSNGISFNALINNIGLISNSYYSTILYICYDNDANINLKEVYSANTYTATFNNKSNYSKELLSNVISRETFTSTNPPNYCRAISFIYQPKIDSSVLNIRLISSGSVGSWYIVGTKTEYIGVANGLTSSQVSNIIDSSISNSNLATANDIQSVNSAVQDLSTDIENMSDDIVNNQNQNTQDIIDNQNANSQAQIDSQKVCTYYDKKDIVLDNKFLSDTNQELSDNRFGITDYIKIISSTIEVLQPYTIGDAPSYCFYNTNKVRISCNRLNTLTGNITIPNGAEYFKTTIYKANNLPQFNICKNGNQAMQDTLTDEHYDNSIIDLSNLPVASNTPISDLLLLPMTLINKLLTSLNNSCSTYQLPFLYGNTLSLPCIDIKYYLGEDLWHIIDLCIVFYMVYNIFMLFINVFDDITSLDDEFQSLYTPRHSGLTRVGRGNMEGLY